MRSISSFSLYEYLTTSDTYDIQRETRELSFNKGEVVYLPGDTLHCMYEVVAGAVKIGSYSEDGDEIVYDVLHQGDFFGNLKYLDSGHFFEFAKSITRSKLRTYDLSFFRKIIVHDSNVSEWFNYYIVHRWNRTERKLFFVNNKDTETRLNYLYSLLDVSIQDKDGCLHRLIDLLSQTDIGNLIGVSRQTVSKYLQIRGSSSGFDYRRGEGGTSRFFRQGHLN